MKLQQGLHRNMKESLWLNRSRWPSSPPVLSSAFLSDARSYTWCLRAAVIPFYKQKISPQRDCSCTNSCRNSMGKLKPKILDPYFRDLALDAAYRTHTEKSQAANDNSMSQALSGQRESLQMKATVPLCNAVGCVTTQPVSGEVSAVPPGSVLFPGERSEGSLLEEKGRSKSQKGKEPRCQNFQKSALS